MLHWRRADFCCCSDSSPAESGLYYLQSRYYDPEIGRFLNADAFVSTGQGLLGNNMFSYCGNCPVSRFDSGGYAFEDTDNRPFGNARTLQNTYGAGGGLWIAAGTAIIWTVFQAAAQNTVEILQNAYSEVLEYSRELQDASKTRYDNSQPRVHHIVPWGAYSNRKTSAIIRDMQNILIEVGIDPKSDPINMVIISQGYHKSLHTDLYMIELHSILSAVRGNAFQIKLTLFFYGIGLSNADPYATGF